VVQKCLSINTVRCTKSADAHAGRHGFKFQVVLSLKRAPQQETLCVCYSNRLENTGRRNYSTCTYVLVIAYDSALFSTLSFLVVSNKVRITNDDDYDDEHQSKKNKEQTSAMTTSVVEEREEVCTRTDPVLSTRQMTTFAGRINALEMFFVGVLHNDLGYSQRISLIEQAVGLSSSHPLDTHRGLDVL
jgi:hypothetical protein